MSVTSDTTADSVKPGQVSGYQIVRHLNNHAYAADSGRPAALNIHQLLQCSAVDIEERAQQVLTQKL